MTEIEQRKIFARNLNRQLEINGKTQKEVAEAIHVLPTTFNTWCTGTALPRMGKVQLLAEYFNIKKSDLIDDKETDAPTWYSDPETAAIAQELFENSDLRALMSAARDVTPEQLRATRKLLLSFKDITDDE